MFDFFVMSEEEEEKEKTHRLRAKRLQEERI